MLFASRSSSGSLKSLRVFDNVLLYKLGHVRLVSQDIVGNAGRKGQADDSRDAAAEFYY